MVVYTCIKGVYKGVYTAIKVYNKGCKKSIHYDGCTQTNLVLFPSTERATPTPENTATTRPT